MGFLDSLFGSGPKVNTQELSTLTPEQQQALNQLLRQLSGSPASRFEGDVTVDPSTLENLSLAGLEERAIALADPNRDMALLSQATDVITRLMDFESQEAGIDDFFRTNVRDPLVQDFEENVLPQIGRSFGGSSFFSSERAGADEAARGDLVDSLVRSRESLAFNARESDRNRALQALGLVPAFTEAERGNSRELQQLFAAGQARTGLEERNVEREFGQFLAEAGLDQDRINQLLAGINTQAKENVVTVTPGHSGIIGGALSALGGGGITDILSLFKKKPTPTTNTRIGGGG